MYFIQAPPVYSHSQLTLYRKHSGYIELSDDMKDNKQADDWPLPKGRQCSSSHSSLQKTPRQSVEGGASRTSTLVNIPRCESPAIEDKDPQEDEPELQFREAPQATPEYPSALKMAFITTGICLCVFCMALVG